MDIFDVKKFVGEGEWMLQTWTNGKQRIGLLAGILTIGIGEGADIVFERSATEEPMLPISSGRNAQLLPFWEEREGEDLAVPSSTEFSVDPFGRIMFSMGKLGLATLYPPTIDPRQPIPPGS
jgi:hypothetical protein